MRIINYAFIFIVLASTLGCTNNKEATQIANPASTFCVEQGYKLDIRTTDGGQIGYCVFPDGAECEEWAFFRKECQRP